MRHGNLVWSDQDSEANQQVRSKQAHYTLTLNSDSPCRLLKIFSITFLYDPEFYSPLVVIGIMIRSTYFLVKTKIVLTISSLFLNELIDQIRQEMQQN